MLRKSTRMAVSLLLLAVCARTAGAYVSADFNDDGKKDLLLQNTVTGQMAAWYMDADKVIGGAYVYPAPDPAWHAVAVWRPYQQFDNVLLLQNVKTGQLGIWSVDGFYSGYQALYQGGAALIYPQQSPDWRAVCYQDFNGDGNPDIIFQSQTTGQLAIWYMNVSNYAIVGHYLWVPNGESPNRRFIGKGDFYGNGQIDLLFQDKTTGRLTYWLMDDQMRVRAEIPIQPAQDPTWQAVAVADYDGNGASDIVFQNQKTGQLALWLMSGPTAVAGRLIGPIPVAGWQVAGPR